jgi:MarR family transcriptional regulator, organic hydroperoxide resistance regulator
MPRRRDPLPWRQEPAPPLGSVLDFMRLLWAIDHGLQLTSKRMAVALGITGLQRLVIRLVGQFPGISAGQVAAILHLDPSTVTPVLKDLTRSGLLDRRADPLDGRRLLLGLTAKGRVLDVPAPGTIETAVEKALNELPPAKVEAAKEVLSSLARALQG